MRTIKDVPTILQEKQKQKRKKAQQTLWIFMCHLIYL